MGGRNDHNRKATKVAGANDGLEIDIKKPDSLDYHQNLTRSTRSK